MTKQERVIQICRDAGYSAEGFDYGLTVGVAFDGGPGKRHAVMTPRPKREETGDTGEGFVSCWAREPEAIAADMIAALEDWKRK